MNDSIYHKLAKTLDTLPNGFPSTDSGVEIKLLKKIFTPEEADLFCDMRLTFETAEQIAERTGRPLDGLEEMLVSMRKRGQIFSISMGNVRFFKMMPWVFGIYEFQLSRLDREFAELNEKYAPVFSKQFFENKPQLMQTLPIEKGIPIIQEALPYEKVSTMIDNGQSFMVQDCICKKEQVILGNHCDKPLRVCLAIAPIPGVFHDHPLGHVISREEAYELLKKTEEVGLVHVTENVQNGQFYICNCCGCCCGILRGINKLGIPASSVINSHYYAEIDPGKCVACGICARDRCQVNAIEEGDDSYHIIRDKCIGCGLCIPTCSGDAIKLIHKSEDELVPPPLNTDEWFKERGRLRGVEFSKYQ